MKRSPGLSPRRKDLHILLALVVAAAAAPLAAQPGRRDQAVRPAVILDPANGYSLNDAALRPGGGKVLVLKLRLAGGGGKTWLAENCNPVMPVVGGNPVALKRCFTNFYDKVVLQHGRGETLTLEWPVDSPDAPLLPDHNYRLAVSLATDCRGGGPGRAAMGDCRTVRVVQSPVFRIRPAFRDHHHHDSTAADPVAILDPGNRYSLAAAVTRSDGTKVLPLKLLIKPGDRNTWVTESCNPVAPVVGGNPVPTKQCFTNFYAAVIAEGGKGDTLEFDWPVGGAGIELRPGASYQLQVVAATACTRSSGPGLFAMGDCRRVLPLRSPAFTITE